MLERRWITVWECSERLQLHPKSIYRMIAHRQIPTSRVGRLLRIDWAAVEKKLEAEAGKAK